MDDDSRRFVDNDQCGVFKDNVERYVFRRWLGGCRLRYAHTHPVPLVATVRRPHTPAVQLNVTLFDPVLGASATKVVEKNR